MTLEECLIELRRQGYKVIKPRTKSKGGTVNPLGHPYPHAELYNVKLTPISRLSKVSCKFSQHLIKNNDPRNYTISGKTP